MKNDFLFVVAAVMVFASPSTAMQFKCKGNMSQFEIIDGYYRGEASDIVTVNTSSVYSIFSSDGTGRLDLERKHKPFRTGIFEDYPIQFAKRQSDDLGVTNTTLGIPLGTFGRSHKPFKAALRVTGLRQKAIEHIFECETLAY